MIYVIGDIMLDKYLFGTVNRMSPEAPVPIILKESNELFIGGAGNVAYNLKNLTEKVKIFSIIGKDDNGKIVQKKLKEKGIDFEYIESEDSPTITKTRYLSGNKQVLRVDKEKKFSLKESQDLFKKVKKNIKVDNPDLILISDYDKMTIHKSLKIEEYINPKMMVVDSKKTKLELFQNALIYKSNYKELCNVANKKVERNEFRQVTSDLVKKYNFDVMVTTLGSEGCFFMDKNLNYGLLEAEKVEVSDVTGAGDNFISVLTFLLSNNYELEKSVKIATKYATESVKHIGNYFEDIMELKK
jgi:D-beta-D-heptose 7-phosphate kinase/D-beta-D-heptose 1-phosphate adenosyltransferase